MSISHTEAAEALDIALYGQPNIYTPPEAFMPRRSAIAEKLAELFPAAVDVAQANHKSEAENELLASRSIVRNFEGATPEVLESLAEAQVHATLAVAEATDRQTEQAHIRNHIEACNTWGSNPAAWPSEIRDGLVLA